MKETKQEKIDEQIAEHLLISSFYEMMSQLIVSLGNSTLPISYQHPIVNVFEISLENKTISEGITKSLKTKLEKITKGSKIDRIKVVNALDHQKEKCKTKIESLIAKRNS